MRHPGAGLASIWTQLVMRLHFLQGHQVGDIDSTCVGEGIICRVQVDDGAFSARESEILLQAIAICGFPAARRPHYPLPKGHTLLTTLKAAIVLDKTLLQDLEPGCQSFGPQGRIS